MLQPYNHLCVPEYDRITRAADLRVLHHHQRSASAQRTSEGEGTHEDTSTTAEEDATRGAKRKRKSKKKASGLTAPEGGGSGAGRYDQALLAVVGILDALKLEDNVSHWIRARRVWPDQEPAAKQPRTLAADPDREPPTKKPRTLAADPGDAGADADADMLWWKDAAALEHWASRGKEALAELGIEPDAGIED